MIRYEFFDEGKMLITKYIGDIDKEVIKSYIRHIFTKFNCENLKYCISDYRNSSFLFNSKDLENILKTRKEVDKGLVKSHTVFLVDTPRETALVNLISDDYVENSHPADFCSTLKCCINALSLEIDQEELSKCI
jgi:hypothetical protein